MALKFEEPAKDFRIGVVLGNRGFGKTGTFFRVFLIWYVLKRFKQFMGDIVVYIFDLEKNYNYEKIECLTDRTFDKEKKELIKHICSQPIPIRKRGKIIKKGVIRILPEETESGGAFASKIFTDITENRNIKNCAVVVEDAARFMPANNQLDVQLRNMIINAKQRSMDLLLFFHSWEDVPPNLIRWIDDLYLHKVDTSATWRQDKLGPAKLAKVVEAEKEVNAHPSKYFMKHVILNAA